MAWHKEKRFRRGVESLHHGNLSLSIWANIQGTLLVAKRHGKHGKPAAVGFVRGPGLGLNACGFSSSVLCLHRPLEACFTGQGNAFEKIVHQLLIHAWCYGSVGLDSL